LGRICNNKDNWIIILEVNTSTSDLNWRDFFKIQKKSDDTVLTNMKKKNQPKEKHDTLQQVQEKVKGKYPSNSNINIERISEMGEELRSFSGTCWCGYQYLCRHSRYSLSRGILSEDFRGPNGVWTLKDKGEETDSDLDFEDVLPTLSHMVL
jgi:hypothetical protein